VVSRSAQIDHPLIREHEHPQRAAILILTSDRGFCGGYNSNVLREAQSLRGLLAARGIEPVTYVSAEGIIWHRFRGREIAGSWHGFSETPAAITLARSPTPCSTRSAARLRGRGG